MADTIFYDESYRIPQDDTDMERRRAQVALQKYRTHMSENMGKFLRAWSVELANVREAFDIPRDEIEALLEDGARTMSDMVSFSLTAKEDDEE